MHSPAPTDAARPTTDLISIGVCALVWGTTWYVITLQFGAVDPIVSVVYRFAIASGLLFLWCRIRGERIELSRAQHGAALSVGFFTFALDYACVYQAEARVTSAVVAVMFGATALINLIVFRLLFRQRALAGAWVAAGLGALGVLLMSWQELVQSQLDTHVLTGLAFAFVAVISAVLGNANARRGEQVGAPLGASTAFSMGYGAVLLAVFALLSGRSYRFEMTASYVISLLYLSAFGSVLAFLLYFRVARRRGYTTAAYITALTPLIAMVMSSLFEAKHWRPLSLAGIAFVVLGQWLMLRTR